MPGARAPNYSRIMAITRHQAMAVITRYNTIDRHTLHKAIRQPGISMDAVDVTAREIPAYTIEKSGMGR
jgi:hypothetical protein